MTPAPSPSPTAPLTAADVFPVARAAAVLGGGTLAVAGLLYAALLLSGQPLHATLNLLAAVLCGVAGLVALLPVWLGSKQSSHGAATGFMMGILIRMTLAGGVVLYLQWSARWPHARLLSLWVAGWYLIVLLIEVKLISSFVTAVAPGSPRYPQAATAHRPAPAGDTPTNDASPA